MSHPSSPPELVTAEPVPPVGPRRAAFNRAILEHAVRSWDRRAPRRVRRTQRQEAISRGVVA